MMSEGNGNGKITRLCVSRADSFKMAHWIDAHWDSLKTMTRDQACAELSKLIGKPVTCNAMKGLFDDIGKEWPGRSVERKTGAQKGTERTRIIARNLIRLGKAVEYMAKEMGTALPPDLVLEMDTLVKIRQGIPIDTESDWTA